MDPNTPNAPWIIRPTWPREVPDSIFHQIIQEIEKNHYDMVVLGRRGHGRTYYLVPIHKWPICPISVLCEKFYPRNINHMPAVKFFARLDLDQICDGHQFGAHPFLDGHYLGSMARYITERITGRAVWIVS